MRVCILVVSLMWTFSVEAQTYYRFRVVLKDKSVTEYKVDEPESFLSERAIERRRKQNIAIDSTDLPVCEAYIRKLESQGGRCVMQSKWNNTVLMETASERHAEAYAKNEFVKSVRMVWQTPLVPSTKANINRKDEVTNENKKSHNRFGLGQEQIQTHRGDKLHQLGYRGNGMHIAVIDAGYYNVDAIKLFSKTKIMGTRDFVNPYSDIYAEHNHGLKVLSCMAANKPYALVGTAPEASYWLLRSEDNDSEQLAEEDYWASAVEYADSVGVDIINTSLGYYEFDNSEDNHKYSELDGHTSVMSASASMIAEKGMVLVCSAGNTGLGRWKKITPPADAENIITVGAIDTDGMNTDFSAVGNTADGRVKPDIMAVGYRVSVAGTHGGTSYANGTSFSAPLITGLVACLWQACPWLSAKDVIEVVIKSGDRYKSPDNVYGYGVADMYAAYKLAQEKKE